jgi:plasmid stabilization system protein ParE
MTPVRILRKATRRIRNIAAHYEKEAQMGRAFTEDLADAIQRISENPDAYQMIDEKHRRLVMKRFPCSVVYRPLTNVVNIIAVVGHRQMPDSWKR